MTPMNPKDDARLKAFLSDYAAPITDDGFSDRLMALAAQEASLNNAPSPRERRIRRWALYGAYFVGGVIAAVQMPTLRRVMQGALEAMPSAAPLPTAEAGQWLSAVNTSDMLGNMPLMALTVAGLSVALIMVWVIANEGADLA